MARARQSNVEAVAADLVWSAAQAAYRINGGFFKLPVIEDDKIVKPTNREIVTVALRDHNLITDADREQAQKCRNYMASQATLAALKNQLNEWSVISSKVCAKDLIDSNYDIAVITAMPQSYARSVRREEVDGRLARCESIDSPIGTKVELTGEVVRCQYSARFNTWYITVVTNEDNCVYFGYREAVDLQSTVTFRGTVKRHNDRASQLNRVKIVGETV